MNRETFKDNAKKSIDDIFLKIDELEAKKDNVKEESKEKYEEKLQELKTTKDNLKIKYKDLMNAKDEKWTQTKQAFSQSADYFKKGLSELATIIKS